MVEQPLVSWFENEGMQGHRGPDTGHTSDRERRPAKCQGGGSRQEGGVAEGEMLKLLMETKAQLGDLQSKVDYLIRKERGLSWA